MARLKPRPFRTCDVEFFKSHPSRKNNDAVPGPGPEGVPGAKMGHPEFVLEQVKKNNRRFFDSATLRSE